MFQLLLIQPVSFITTIFFQYIANNCMIIIIKCLQSFRKLKNCAVFSANNILKKIINFHISHQSHKIFSLRMNNNSMNWRHKIKYSKKKPFCLLLIYLIELYMMQSTPKIIPYMQNLTSLYKMLPKFKRSWISPFMNN